jgi:hypothetical protein
VVAQIFHAHDCHAQQVATCAGAAPGTVFGAVWLPCPAGVVYQAPVSNLIVASQISAQGSTNEWQVASALAQDDQVYTNTPNPKSPTSNWWAVSQIKFASPTPPPAPIPSPPPSPPGGGCTAGVVSLNWTAPTKNTNGTAIALPLTYSIFDGPSGKESPTPVLSGIVTTTATVTNLATSASICFDVEAVDANGASIPSAEACGIPQCSAAVIQIAAPVANADGTTPVTPLSTYRVCARSTVTGSKAVCAWIPANTTTYVLPAALIPAAGNYWVNVGVEAEDVTISVPSNVLTMTVTAPSVPSTVISKAPVISAGSQ